MTRQQLALVHLAKKQLALKDEEYRAILGRGGAEHANELTARGFRVVMIAFGRLGFESTSARRPLGFRPGRASDGQLAAIRAAWLAYAPQDKEWRGLRTWLQRKWKIGDLRWITAEQAPKIIGALQHMRRWRQEKDARDPDPPPAA